MSHKSKAAKTREASSDPREEVPGFRAWFVSETHFAVCGELPGVKSGRAKLGVWQTPTSSGASPGAHPAVMSSTLP